MAALRAAPAGQGKLVLAEDAPGSRVAEIANAVMLDRAAPAPAPRAADAPAADGIDRAAASAELTRAANLVGMCRRPGGDTGPGKALVVVGTSGRVESVSIEGKLAGGPVGECVARNFRTVKVPAFSGSSVTLSKSFVVPD
ncbi:MAG: hypothetical protein FJ104_14370 [Deltaproteobacteria bacterium]|nr:hypothetical protein [Deltaproteobacteria bacterium]